MYYMKIWCSRPNRPTVWQPRATRCGPHHRRTPAARAAPPPPRGLHPRRTPAARSAPHPHPRRTFRTPPLHPRRTASTHTVAPTPFRPGGGGGHRRNRRLGRSAMCLWVISERSTRTRSPRTMRRMLLCTRGLPRREWGEIMRIEVSRLYLDLFRHI